MNVLPRGAQCIYTVLVVWTSSVLVTVVTGSPLVSVHTTVVQVRVGGDVLLPCRTHVSAGNPHASWTRPRDGRIISRDGQVALALRDRARVTGNRTQGEFHLHILYAKFPDDNGTWWCDIFDGTRVHVSLVVLVPPASPKPIITPFMGTIFQVTSEAWTFTCLAHHAYPPVSLSWEQVSGPHFPFSRLPPGGVSAPDGTVSVSSGIILTAFNNNSVFACHAKHPTFDGELYSARISFKLVDPSMPSATAMQLQLEASMKTPSFTPGDMALVTAGLVLLLVFTCTAGTLWRTSHRWELDVGDHDAYMHLSTCETTATCILDTNSTAFVSEKKDGGRTKGSAKGRCISRLAVAGVLLSVIIAVLTFIIPVYIRAFSMPITGVDQVVPVLTGSLLWLDCSGVAGQGDDLLEVVWRKGLEPFYTQYPAKSEGGPLSIPVNYTHTGTTLGQRIHMHGIGQVSLFPVVPDDQGLYICEAARVLDDRGHTTFKRQTFAVFVMKGNQISVTLLVLVCIGLFSSILLFCFGIYHSIRRAEPQKNHRQYKGRHT